MPDTCPLALQLWTIRDAMTADPADALRRVAALGFRAVEPFGVGGTQGTRGERLARTIELRKLLDDNDLAVCAVHGQLPAKDDDLDAVFEELAALGTDCLVAAAPVTIEGCADALSSADGVRAMADRLTASAERAARYGITIGYHNHAHEFEPLPDGRLPYDVLWQHAGPDVVAEVDVYWVMAGGQDPAAVISGLAQRARLLHLKDGPADTTLPQTALGQGSLDIDGLLVAADGHARWHIVELDGCATDVFAAAGAGAAWLVERGWSRWAVA